MERIAVSGAMSRPAADRPAHIVYFDWLKFLVVYGIVVYHTALPFSYTSWLIESRDRSTMLSGFTAFTFPWGIPLLFLLSGAGEYFALRSKPVIPFLVRRILRLGFPLALGLILLSPLQAYFLNHATNRDLESALRYYPRFLSAMRLDWTPQWLGHYGYHLWFLGYLLAITIVTLPVMMWLHRPTGRRSLSRLAAFSHRRGGILVFAAPLAVSQLALRARFPAYQDWADIATYTIVFLAGYVMIADRGFTTAIERNGGLALTLGVVSTAVLGGLLYLSAGHVSGGPAATAYQIAFNVAWSLDVWCWCVCVLYLGVRWMTASNRLVRYGSESALPVYIISHPVVVVLGTYVVTWNLPLWPRFLLLTALSFGVILAIYELGVRRWTVTRFLFGLKPLRQAD